MRYQCDDVHLEFVLVEQIRNIQLCGSLLPPSSPKKPTSMLFTRQQTDLPSFGVEIMGSSTVTTVVWSLTCIHKLTSHYVWLSLNKFLGPLKPFLEVLAYSDMTLLLFHAQQEGNELMEICTHSDCLWKCSELTQTYFLMTATSKIIILMLFLRTSSLTWCIFLLILFVSGQPEPSAIQATPLDFWNH